MEQDLGLDDLSEAERDVFLAAQSLSKSPDGVLTSTEIRHHELVVDFPPATYYRALRTLVELGYLKKAAGAKTKSYVLANQ